ncbi:hypothetical protein CgunFtcFv8_000161 [Champsocephalus gunnari]|uniref:Uncharacterized protein n=1 Tax=Champsocephalus gunnari TaxID=52237 RepID=A0AAN8HP21_CHAGU|nr:hypothetical protein CgunFtcFv8_000161 [Champsocephalus gunnari]
MNAMQQKDEKKKENAPARENMNGARADRRGGGKEKETVKVKHIQRDQCTDFTRHIQGSARLKALQAHSSKW